MKRGVNRFTAQKAGEVKSLNQGVGDPFGEWRPEPLFLPEPVHLEPGKRYEAGIEDGVPYVKELTDE